MRRVLPTNEKQYRHDWHIKNRERQPSFDSIRECPAHRILGNQAMMQLLSLKLERKGEEATATFLESLGCSEVEGVLRQIKNPWPFEDGLRPMRLNWPLCFGLWDQKSRKILPNLAANGIDFPDPFFV
jgi:hypothetical protein